MCSDEGLGRVAVSCEYGPPGKVIQPRSTPPGACATTGRRHSRLAGCGAAGLGEVAGKGVAARALAAATAEGVDVIAVGAAWPQPVSTMTVEEQAIASLLIVLSVVNEAHRFRY